MRTVVLLLAAFVTMRRVGATGRVVGWYNGEPPLARVPWHLYSHVRYGEPVVDADGVARCNATQMAPIVAAARAARTRVLWGPGNVNVTATPSAYWATIRGAVEQCGVDGIEVDHESGPNALGVVTPERATLYSRWLARLRRTIGRPVSADVAIWGLAEGNYIFGFLPWVNVSMLNRGEIDYINTMSYHWNRQGDTWAWKKDVWFLLQLWKIDPARVNLGIGYFSKRWTTRGTKRHLTEPTWRELSPRCPNAAASSNWCNGTAFVGKAMNYAIGGLIRRHKLGGAFPWELSYDSYANNNTLVDYLVAGMRAEY